MSRQALEVIIGRALLDEDFRMALFADPDAALAGYELTLGELAALKSVDAESLDACARSIRLRLALSFPLLNPPDSVPAEDHESLTIWY